LEERHAPQHVALIETHASVICDTPLPAACPWACRRLNDQCRMRSRRAHSLARVDSSERQRAEGRLTYTKAAKEIEDFVGHPHAYLYNLKSIADGAQRVANDLENYGQPPSTQ
jgi:hypothetical protein